MMFILDYGSFHTVVRVLERIVTSRGYTVAEEIEELRREPNNRAPALEDNSADIGVPLNLNAKEKQS